MTCIDGTSRTLFVGTSQGRILLVDLSTRNVINVLQLSTVVILKNFQNPKKVEKFLRFVNMSRFE